MQPSLRLVPLVLVSLALLRAVSAAPELPAAPAGGVHDRIGVIDMQGAVAGCNDGQRDFAALAAKFEPRRAELQRANAEIEDLKKQLNAPGGKLTAEARDALVKSIEAKVSSLQHTAEAAQNEFQQQQNEIAQRILQKMSPLIMQYVADNGYALLLDASTPWPQGPVVIATQSVNITKAVVDAYNARSGTPAPAKASAPAKPAPVITVPGTGTKSK